MTHSDPIPGNGGDDSYDIDSELHSRLDAKKIEDIEFGEFDLQNSMREDEMVRRLLDDNFPLLPEILEIRTQLGEESGLTVVYEHLVARAGELRDEFASTPDPSEELKHDYQLTYLQSRLVIAIQQLAAAKGAQESVLDQAQKIEDSGDIELANMWREFAYETRKDAEAQALTNESLGEKTATRILSAIAPEFKGESLLPITAASQEYLVVYRLKEEKSDDDRTEVKAYTKKAREILESKLSDGQRQHPDFEGFAFMLCNAAARATLEPKHTLGLTSMQQGTYRLMIDYNVADAVNTGPQIGIDPVEVRAIYEDILARLS